MKPDWIKVTRNHILQVCEIYDARRPIPKLERKSSFLVLNDRLYPSQYIQGLAYLLATGIELDPERDCSHGREMVMFFKNLGF